MNADRLPVRRGLVTEHLEYFLVGAQKYFSTVRRVRRTGQLAA
jgi:hypothetical protein